MTPDNYCIKVCGGKCCFFWEDERPVHVCPHLRECKRCRVHHRWKRRGYCDEVYTILTESGALVEVETQSIGRIIQQGLLPEWIEEQCCYAHPELLKDDEPVILLCGPNGKPL